ncbi:hypothetical protein [Bacillus sp. OAE603]|uniref:hypothetical protein n=1 Tax=Gottfriedia sp. OAE603 TaxID=2663872 RepID=UPI00178976CB
MTLTPTSTSFAEINKDTSSQVQNFIVSDVEATNDFSSFTIFNEEHKIDFSIKQTDSSIVINTVTDGKESHSATLIEGDSFLTLDGEQIEIQRKSYQDPEFAKKVKTQLAVNPWTPKYVTTYENKVSKTFTTVGAIATVIGAVIAGGAVAGVALATTAIATSISNWVGIVGGGTLLAGGLMMTVSSYYSLYQTTGLVPTGYGSNQYAYRYQDIGA